MEPNKVISGRRIVFGAGGDHLLGPDTIVRESEVVIDCRASDFTIARTVFESCSLVFTKRLHDDDFFSARFAECSFSGYLHGLRFGRFTVDYEDEDGWETFGDVRDCSFREAILHLTDFLNVDMSSVDLPGWPCFALLDPARRTDLLSYSWPGRLATLAKTFTQSPSFCTAVVCHAPDLVRDYGVTLDEMHGALSEAGGFLL